MTLASSLACDICLFILVSNVLRYSLAASVNGSDFSCNKNTCVNGVCSQEGTTCDCDHFWTGRTCNISNYNCSSATCMNGGRCLDKNQCMCAPGWTGQACNLSSYSWTQWSTPSECSVTCGIGHSHRSRRCLGPNGTEAPTFSTLCSDPLKQPAIKIQICNNGDCLSPGQVIGSPLGKAYRISPIPVTFQKARSECLNNKSRIVSNVSSSAFQKEMEFFLTNLPKNFSRNISNMTFWVYPGEFSIKDTKTCFGADFMGNISARPCSKPSLTLCESPMLGKCYPEVNKKFCNIYGSYGCRFEISRSKQPDIKCNCRHGLQFNATSGICEDIKECMLQKPASCHPPTVCQDVFGSYMCGCEPGQQGNGNDTCGYLLTMKQSNINLLRPTNAWANMGNILGNIPYGATWHDTTVNKDSLTMAQSNINLLTLISYNYWNKAITGSGYMLPVMTHTTPDDAIVIIGLQYFLNDLYHLILANLTRKIHIKSIKWDRLDNVTAYFDVYVENPTISPSTLKHIFQSMETTLNMYWIWIKESTLAADQFRCRDTKLRLGSSFYNFPEASSDSRVGSKEKCKNGRSRATASCVWKMNKDGTRSTYFDYKSVTAVPCEVTTASLLGMASARSSVDILMSDIASMTTDFQNASAKALNETVGVLAAVGSRVERENLRILVATWSNVINTVSNINLAQTSTNTNRSKTLLTNEQKRIVVQSLGKCTSHVALDPGETAAIATKYVVAQVSNVMNSDHNASTMDGVYFSSNKSLVSEKGEGCATTDNWPIESFVNEDILEKEMLLMKSNNSNVTDMPVSFIYFTDAGFFSSDSPSYKIEQEARSYMCAYLDPVSGRWLSDGCRTVLGSNPTKCMCDHMTSFAVLVQTHHKNEDYALGIFGQICCVISALSLLLMIGILLYFPYLYVQRNLRRSQVALIHCQLGFNLMIVYIIVLAAIEKTRPQNLCITSAAFLHFFLLNTWGWMLVECYTMYRKLVVILSFKSSRYVMKASAAVYIVAALITAITLLVSVAGYDGMRDSGWSYPDDCEPSLSAYVSDRFCWLHGYSLVFGFLIPIGIAFTVNLFGSISVLRAISWGRQKVTSSLQDKADFRAYFLRAITMSVLLGTGWVFAIPLTLSDEPSVDAIFGWFFSAFTALQGLFLFILLCVRPAEVRSLWVGKLQNSFVTSKPSSESGIISESVKDTNNIAGSRAANDTAQKTTKFTEGSMGRKDDVLS